MYGNTKGEFVILILGLLVNRKCLPFDRSTVILKFRSSLKMVFARLHYPKTLIENTIRYFIEMQVCCKQHVSDSTERPLSRPATNLVLSRKLDISLVIANKARQNKMDDNVPVSLICHILGNYDEEIGRLLRNENDFGFVVIAWVSCGLFLFESTVSSYFGDEFVVHFNYLVYPIDRPDEG